MSLHQLLCDHAEQKICNILIRSIAGRNANLIAKLDPELMTDWLSWKLGDWVAVCSVNSLDDPDEDVTEFEVVVRNKVASEMLSRRFARTGGEIKHAHNWVSVNQSTARHGSSKKSPDTRSKPCRNGLLRESRKTR